MKLGTKLECIVINHSTKGFRNFLNMVQLCCDDRNQTTDQDPKHGLPFFVSGLFSQSGFVPCCFKFKKVLFYMFKRKSMLDIFYFLFSVPQLISPTKQHIKFNTFCLSAAPSMMK